MMGELSGKVLIRVWEEILTAFDVKLWHRDGLKLLIVELRGLSGVRLIVRARGGKLTVVDFVFVENNVGCMQM